MKECETALGKQVAPEFFRSQIEIGTGVLKDFKAAREELAGLRRTIADVAQRARPGARSPPRTHPFADRSTLETTPKARYQALAGDFAGIGRRLAICGMHVHVGIDDDELRIDLMNQVRYFLPHLLMLSTSSPFWQGEDTGLKSYRLAVFHELPRTGLPQRFESFGEYQRTVDVLVRNKVIEDATKIWWDLRPSAKFPTLEMRVTDVVHAHRRRGVHRGALRLHAAHAVAAAAPPTRSWRSYPVVPASRRTAGGRSATACARPLFDFGKGELVPFASLIDELLDLIAEDAAVLGCEREVRHALSIATGGTSADRQVARYKKLMQDGASADAALDRRRRPAHRRNRRRHLTSVRPALRHPASPPPRRVHDVLPATAGMRGRHRSR